jgi:hypothetical protein
MDSMHPRMFLKHAACMKKSLMHHERRPKEGLFKPQLLLCSIASFKNLCAFLILLHHSSSAVQSKAHQAEQPLSLGATAKQRILRPSACPTLSRSCKSRTSW